jgi:hypothetical protein
MERKEIQMKYDADAYYHISETGRLVKLEKGLPKLLSDAEAERFANRQVGPTLIFSNMYTFDTTHLGQILRIHTPVGADSYTESCKQNVLTLKFYRTREPSEQACSVTGMPEVDEQIDGVR